MVSVHIQLGQVDRKSYTEWSDTAWRAEGFDPGIGSVIAKYAIII